MREHNPFSLRGNVLHVGLFGQSGMLHRAKYSRFRNDSITSLDDGMQSPTPVLKVPSSSCSSSSCPPSTPGSPADQTSLASSEEGSTTLCTFLPRMANIKLSNPAGLLGLKSFALATKEPPSKGLSAVLGKSNLQFAGMNIKLIVSTNSLSLTTVDSQQSGSPQHISVYENCSLTQKQLCPTVEATKAVYNGLPDSSSLSVLQHIKEQLRNEVWYHGKMCRKEAESLLTNNGDFLVRESTTSPGQYVLSGLQEGTAKHLLLVDPQGMVRTKDHLFNSVGHLIRYHVKNQRPIISSGSELCLREPALKTTVGSVSPISRRGPSRCLGRQLSNNRSSRNHWRRNQTTLSTLRHFTVNHALLKYPLERTQLHARILVLIGQFRYEKEGLALTLQESGKLIKDGKEKEVQLSGQIKALEFQVQTLTANEEKNLEKQKAAEAALDSMQQQMMELCRSESLTRAREQHESILAALKEKHEDKVLALQQKLDAQSHALEEQISLSICNCMLCKLQYTPQRETLVSNEKEGLALTLQESGKLIKDGKEKEVQLSGQIKALEFQVQTLTANEEKNLEKQKAAEAALDSMQQQMMELCRSESLTRAREQHESILAALKEKHEDKVLALQQKLDAQSHALEEQKETCHRFREQIKQQERQQEEAKLEKIEIINRLAKSLEESQQQCTNLLQTGTVQELNQLRFQLQQAQSAKNISDSMNKSLQEELGELKEQITLYESAGKFGILSTDPCGDSEAPMSDSYVELGIKNVNWKNTKFHSTSSVGRTDKSMSKDDMIMELKAELERFLGSFKVKRRKITQLQDELKQSQRQMHELKTQLEKAEKNAKDHEVRENGLEKQLETSVADKAVKEEVERLQRENQALQQVIEKLRHQIKELRNSKETLKSANQELCTEMRKMMQDFDQDKQETTERYEKTHQQHREDIVSHLRGELLQEHALEKEQLTQLYEEKIHYLEIKLSDLNQEMVGVQECYITVCKEKNLLEEDLRGKLEQEMALKENELKKQFSEENKHSLESFKSELEEKHRIFKATTKEQLMKEMKADLKQQVNTQVALAKISWQDEQKQVEEEAILKAVNKVEEEWSQRLQKSINDIKHECLTDKREQGCQTEQSSDAGGIPEEEMEEKMKAQRLKLQQEAEACQAIAVREAMKKTQGELEKKHQENVAKQVETAVSNAYTRWCNELNAFPEYKASLQSEKEKWEKEHEQDVAKRISTVLKAAEERWKKTHLKEIDRMEASAKNTEEKALSLQRKLDHQKKEEAALIKAELAKAHAQWNREKREEINKIHEANEKDYRAFLEEHRSKLNEVVAVAKEDFERQKKELIIRKETDFKQILDRKQKEWSTQQAMKIEREKRQIEDEILIELEVLLGEIKELLVQDPNSQSQSPDKSSSTPKQAHNQYFGKLKACLKSEEKLRCALTEEKLRHEQEMKAKEELGIHHNGIKHPSEYEEAIKKEREEGLRRLQEVKASGKTAATGSQTEDKSEPCIQEGLEEIREQYLRAVCKIRGDMLRYIQESKARAAEMIRVEVLRERQETARKMRTYYLTCLQQLLEDGGKKEG
ncbi:UNVERIFIED_CONTAM: hypothetical protein FKN15_011376 [Acipenser sinensis]